MPGPTTLTINMVPNSISNTVSVTIPSALQALDSTTPGATQTGFSSVDVSIRNIFKAGCFVDGTGRWWSSHQILSIVAS